MDLRFRCPACGQKLAVDPVGAGRKTTCPTCGNRLTIPHPTPEPPPSPPVVVTSLPVSPPTGGWGRPVAAQGVEPPPPPPLASPPPPAFTAPPPIPAFQPVRREPAAVETPVRPAVVWPWEVAPGLLAKMAAYDSHGVGKKEGCFCTEVLNRLLPSEAASKAQAAFQFKVYPDLVGVDRRQEAPSWLERWPLWLRRLLAPWLAALGGVSFSLGCLLSLPSLLVGLVLTIPALALALLTWPFRRLWRGLAERRTEAIARRVRASLRSSYAIRQLFRRSALGPRVWQRGEVVQIVRLEARRWVKSYPVLVLVQDDPLPLSPGYSGTGVLLAIGRLLRPQRRLYVVRLAGHPSQAEALTARAAEVLGAPVLRGRLSALGLRLEPAPLG